ncbi:Beta-1,3-glucosyltransferase protein [Spatholobus suberectus]|nr:Beta-1,3-glucosyltransferase protein [Spatholobus suberectus]
MENPSLPHNQTQRAPHLFLKAGLAVSTFFLITLFFYHTLSYQHNSLASFKHVLQHKPREEQEPTNISHLLFGIGGSSATWHSRRHYSELWWRRGATRGHVWLERSPPENETWPATSPPYRVSGDTSAFRYACPYGSRSAIRIARIVKESFELGTENVRWFVMGDDDTVFFTDNLVAVLSKYDHNEMYYVGGNSESVEQDVVHFYTMAFGGGGFAVSYPLAKELVRILDGCIDRYAEFYGSDQKIQSCVSEIGVQVTKEPGFHQVDIRGNPYGLLAAHPVAPLVSLHHLDYVDPIFPNMTRVDSVKKLITAYKTDPGRTLQRSFCYDLRRNWTVSVSWGYSVELYPSLRTVKELETAFRTFYTWRSWSDGPFTFNTRPVSGDPCERPLLYLLDRVRTVGGDKTRTMYRRNGSWKECGRDDYARALAVQHVDVSASHFMRDLWKKAPRRQCCEIINGADGVNVRVKIRGCRRFESVTPP